MTIFLSNEIDEEPMKIEQTYMTIGEIALEATIQTKNIVTHSAMTDLTKNEIQAIKDELKDLLQVLSDLLNERRKR